MQRVKTSSAVTSRPAYTETGAPGYFTSGDAVAAIPATVPGAQWFNQVQEEILAVITAGGLTPDATKDNQLAAAIAKMIAAQAVTIDAATETVAGIVKLASLAKTLAGAGDVVLTPLQALAQQLADPWAVTAGGTANALTAALPLAPQAALPDGMRLRLRATAANTGPATLAVTLGTTALGAVPLLKGAGVPLEAGDIAGPGAVLDVQYNATLGAALVLNPAHNPAAGYSQSFGPVGYISHPNGHIMQWGTTGALANNTATTVVFPYAFKDACYGVVATGLNPTATNALDDVCDIVSTSKASFVAYSQDTSGNNAAKSYTYLAWGK